MHSRVKASAKRSEPKKKNSVYRISKTDFSQSIRSPIGKILFLQRAIGNQAVNRLIGSGAIQTKLKIGQPNDRYEQEAERIAEQIVTARSPVESGKCEACHGGQVEMQHKPLEAGITPLLQTKSEGEELTLSGSLQSQIKSSQGRGEPLPISTRRFMESCFGADFNRVRMHTGNDDAGMNRELNAHGFTNGLAHARGDGATQQADERLFPDAISLSVSGGHSLPGSERAFFESRLGADLSTVNLHADASSARMAQTLGARAFTVGQHVFFGRGTYTSGSLSTRRLLAHELVHTLQQGAARRIARQCLSRWNAIRIPQGVSSLTAQLAVDMGELRITDTVSVSPVVGQMRAKFVLPRALQQRIAPNTFGGWLQRAQITIDITGQLRNAGGTSAAARYPNNEMCLYVGFSQAEGDAWQADIRVLAGTRLEIPLVIGAGTPLRAPPTSALGVGAATINLRLRQDLSASIGALRISGLDDFRAVWSRIMSQVKNALQIPISNIRIPLDARLRAALSVPLPIPSGTQGVGSGVLLETWGDLRLRTEVSSRAGSYRLRLSGEAAGSILGGLVSIELSGRGQLRGPVPSQVRLGDLSAGFLGQLLAQSQGGGEIRGRLRAFGLPGRLDANFRIVEGRLVGNASLLTPIGIGGGRFGYGFNQGLSAQMGMVGLVNLTIAPAQERLQSEARRNIGPQAYEFGTSVTGLGLTGVALTPRTFSTLSLGAGPQFVTTPTGETRVGAYGGVDFTLRFWGL